MKHGEGKEFKFDRRAEAYDEGFEGRFSRRFYALLLARVKLAPGTRLLDVGCGAGALLREMAAIAAVDCCGIDAEEAMVAVAREKCPGMRIQQARSEAIPFPDDTFDVLTACMAYHHFSDKRGFAREAARVLKPGGRLYIADPRFPLPVRKTLNFVIGLLGRVGEFTTPKEIGERFADFGFELESSAQDGYAQAVTLTLAR